MTKSKLWHIILMVGGALAVLAPDLTGLAASLAGMGIGWLNWVARVLGVLALIGSRWDVIRGKLAPLLIEDRTQLGPPSSGTPVVCLLILGSLLLAGNVSCSSTQPTPAEVGRAVVTCTATVCDQPSGPCAQLTSAVLACLVSAGNVGVCLGGVPALVQVGYADIVCVVDALSYHAPTPEIRTKAAEWLRAQRVMVER